MLGARQRDRRERGRIGHLDHPRRGRVHPEEDGPGESHGPQHVRQRIDPWRRAGGLWSKCGGRASRQRRRSGRSGRRSGWRVMVRVHEADHTLRAGGRADGDSERDLPTLGRRRRAVRVAVRAGPLRRVGAAPHRAGRRRAGPGRPRRGVWHRHRRPHGRRRSARPRPRRRGWTCNEAMLDVARRVRPEIEWRQGDAAHLPFPDGSFDVALCQMAFMFFPDRTRVLREMARVVTAGWHGGLLGPEPPRRTAGLCAVRGDGRAARRARGQEPSRGVLRQRRPRRAATAWSRRRDCSSRRRGPTWGGSGVPRSTPSSPPRWRARRCASGSATRSTRASAKRRASCSGLHARPVARPRSRSKAT